ncbi:uncharacterized protein LOC127082076, partial [Lathyrus oleraceus]|uniref:uncharacterized protein LOC127082076 n=1 Tax=Pisum sativum TaxID=3888 RepID=UPI0021D1F621
MVKAKFHQYRVVGRGLPTETDEHPKIYRMKLWATNEVRAKSKFWYFLRKLKKEVERIIGRNLKDHYPFPKLDEDIPPKRIVSALGLKVSEVVDNWDVKGPFSGFSRKFLEDQAKKMEKEGDWESFYAVLAVLIYGIVLFPNIDHFVDHLAVRIFLSGNPVPFLLADLYYTLHDRHERKGGIVLCCAQLLHAWFRSHMPEEGPFVSKELKPFQKLASLTSSHVKWYIRDWETENVIVSIGDFPNVPLIGTKGCINYNPMLSLRQHGYPMNGPPKAEALEPFILHGIEADHPMVKKIKRSWQAVIRKGKELEPILPEDVEELNARIKELELENADLRIKLGRVSIENGNLKDDQQKKDKELEVSNKRARESEARREKFGQALYSTKSVFKSKEEELDRALLRIQKLNKTLELTLEMKREARLISEIRTRELENTIQKYQDALEREKLKTEESERVCTRLKHHLDRADARIQALEGGDQDAAYMVLLNECRYWRNLYRDIEVTKAEDVRIIQDLQGLYTEWKGKFLKLSGFASSIMRELPEKLQEADWAKLDTQTTVVSEIAGPSIEPQPVRAVPTTWPTYGLPPGFTPTVEGAPGFAPPAQQTAPLPTINENHPVVHTFAPPLVRAHVQPYFEDQQHAPDFSDEDEERQEDLRGMKENYQMLEKRLRAMEGDQVFGATAKEMCLVSGLMIPTKFKTPDFDKYEGHSCPKSHLIMYYRKMVAHVEDDKLMIHCFQDSLRGAPSKWRDIVHPSPMVVCMPTPFPFESTKAVPWKYDITVVDGFVDGKPKIAESKEVLENVDTDITNIAGTSRMTRSGRIYTPNVNVNPQEPTRGAANVNPTPEQGGAQPAVQTDEASEEDFIISQLSSFRYIEADEDALETSFQALEISNATLEEVKDPVEKASLSFASLKSAKSALLHEYVDVFAWSYQDMPGLDTDIVVHKLPLQPDCPPVKQKLRRARPDMALKICDEVKRQFDAGFLAVAKYPQWVANIVPVPKKDGKVRMCVDYRDLNKASPKDDFPLPHIDTLVDNTAKFAVFSFMDGFSGYNQIKMDPEDMEKTTFITPWGTFCYKVMPFGLKNAGATYQRAMVTLFHDMMHKEIEVYVDDMIAKSQSEEDHIDHLQKLFERLRKFRLQLNPAKCTFGVRSGKLLGFIVSQRGIEVDPDKVRAIQEMPAPRTEREVRGFLGRLNYISRFISHMTATCEPIFKLLRKDQAVEWNSDCQMAFERIGQYLQEPPILIPPVQGRPLFMYLTVLEKSMGCVLGQHDETGRKEHAIYYLSKRFTDYESRYSLLEKTCYALAWAARRLRQYMICHTTLLISKMDPIKYIFEKPALTGRLARWQMLLSEYDIQYVSQKAIKGSVLSDYLANQPVEDYQSLKFDFPDEDIMVVKDCEIPGLDEGPEPGSRWKLMFDARLCFDCTNNIAEYEACILGIEAAIDLRIKILEVCGDSALVIYQVKGEWETRDTKLIPYRAYVMELIKYFDEITFRHIPRTENQIADALAMLASMYQVRFHNEAPLIQIERKVEPAYCQLVEEEADGKPWFHDIKCFLQNQEYPTDATTLDKKTLRKLASKFFLSNGVLYKRNHDMILLRCVDGREADLLIKEIHEGSFGTHANGHAMAKKILRAVNVLTSPWPFSMWGIDMIGAIEPKASNGHRFILVAIDYFTKWVEAASYANVTKQVVARFLKKEIICRYGIPSRIITDNGTNLNNKTMKELCESFKIEHHNSSPYRPKMNGAVEAANKNIKKILVYGMEAVLPIEVEIPSMRILMETKLEEAEWIQNRFDQLNLIDEKRLTSLCHGQLYQKRLKRAFDKKVRVREFREGDLVLKKILPIHKDSRGKWTPNYEGPYVVKKVFSGGALILTTMDDEELSHPVNSDAVKK